MDLHVLRSPESENPILSGWSVCTSVISITQKQIVAWNPNFVCADATWNFCCNLFLSLLITDTHTHAYILTCYFRIYETSKRVNPSKSQFWKFDTITKLSLLYERKRKQWTTACFYLTIFVTFIEISPPPSSNTWFWIW